MINEAIDTVWRRIVDAVAFWQWPSWILLEWYGWLFLLAAGLSVVIYFFGWIKFVRAAASIILLLAAIFVAGGHLMFRTLGRRRDG